MPANLHRSDELELDLRRYELRRSDRVLRLEKIPMELLIFLVENKDKLVSREAIVDRLWGRDVFLDAEQGINTAVRKIRQALHDDAEEPRYIQTVVGKGYRLVGRITVLPGDGATPGGATVWPGAAGAKVVGVASPPMLALWNKLALAVILAVPAVLLVVVGWMVPPRRHPPSSLPPQIRSVAILPLENLSGDPSQDYFADGMTEALITDLGKISSLRVISRQSIMQYKGSKKPLQEIARELKVDAVLEGAVERSGDRVRVTVHLERVSPESQVWANEYSRGIRDVMALEGEIARTVTDEIQVKLTPEDRTRLTSAHAVDPEAHDHYLHGRYLLGLAPAHHSKLTDKRQYTELDILAAIGHFKQAIEKDPAYASAYAGLADAYILLGNPVWGGRPPREALSDAKAAATKALELDPSLAEAHFSLAQTLEHDWNWSEAEKEYRLALKLNPNYADAHLEYGRFVQALKRNEEAMTQMNYAIELDPFSVKTRVVVAYVTWASRQYDLAVKQFESLGDDWGLIWACREKEMYPEAIALRRRR